MSLIKSIFKGIIILIVTFLIYSVPFKGRALFYTLSDIGGSWAKETNKNISKTFKEGLVTSKEVGKQLFLNTDPPKKVLQDAIKSQSSSTQRRFKRKNQDPLEDIGVMDKSNLSKIIENE